MKELMRNSVNCQLDENCNENQTTQTKSNKHILKA